MDGREPEQARLQLCLCMGVSVIDPAQGHRRWKGGGGKGRPTFLF